MHEEKGPIEGLHVGAERGVNCEHEPAFLTNMLHRRWEWQEDRRTDWVSGLFRYRRVFMVSLPFSLKVQGGIAHACSSVSVSSFSLWFVSVHRSRPCGWFVFLLRPSCDCVTRIISIINDSSKSHGYHLQTAWLRRTSSGRSTCLYPGKNGGCTQIITQNSQIGMSRHLDSSTTTQMA